MVKCTICGSGVGSLKRLMPKQAVLRGKGWRGEVDVAVYGLAACHEMLYEFLFLRRWCYCLLLGKGAKHNTIITYYVAVGTCTAANIPKIQCLVRQMVHYQPYDAW